MDIQTKDGILLRGIPDGTPDEEIKARIAKIRAGGAAPVERESPTSARNIAGAAIEPMASMATGMLAQPVAGLAGLATGIAQQTGLDKVPLLGSLVPGEAPADVVRGIQEKWTFQPKSEGGQNAMKVLGAPFELLERGADEAGYQLGELTGSPSTGAGAKAAFSMIPALLSGGAAPKGAMPSFAGSRGGAEWLMRSALKPSAIDPKKGTAAVNTLLDEGVNVSRGGADKVSGRIGSINEQIAEALANSNRYVGRDSVLRGLDETRGRFRNQVDPKADLAAIDATADAFATHPSLGTANAIPVQKAQQLKQGTYKVLGDKNYGEVGSAATEAQKGLARRLKEEIANEHPEISPLNARESALINARNMMEHRVATAGNQNPAGLGPLASNTGRTAAFLADRSALVKSLIARAMNPGKGMGITDEMALLSTAPETFSQDAERRQQLIEALLASQRR